MQTGRFPVASPSRLRLREAAALQYLPEVLPNSRSLRCSREFVVSLLKVKEEADVGTVKAYPSG